MMTTATTTTDYDSYNKNKRVLDPILSLPVPSTVNSVCFVDTSLSSSSSSSASKKQQQQPNDNDDQDEEEDEEDEEEEELCFRSTALLLSRQSQTHHQQQQQQHLLEGRYLVTSQREEGTALLWDLQRQRQISTIRNTNHNIDNNNNHHKNKALCVRRTDNPSRILFQTRRSSGGGGGSIIALHSLEQQSSSSSTSVLRTYSTESFGFCEAAPCIGNQHLAVLPYGDNNNQSFQVVDHRASEAVCTIDTTTITVKKNDEGHHHHAAAAAAGAGAGMITSLAMIQVDNNNNNELLVGCGMENGTVVFHNITTTRGRGGCSSQVYSLLGNSNNNNSNSNKDPVLTLDMTPSSQHTIGNNGNLLEEEEDASLSSSSSSLSSVLVAAGMAGDAVELRELSPQEQARVVVFKANCRYNNPQPHDDSSPWTFQERGRLSTCRLDNQPSQGGKPGVGIVRFRPDDGRILAVGGWDHRVRLFERNHHHHHHRGGGGGGCRPLAILKGGNNGSSISALDWAPDAASSSGLLASASSSDDIVNVVHIWKCYGK
jgi:hypothetical protein